MSLLIQLVSFMVAIGILVVVHEFGHYLIARAAGVKVLRFSVGFGRPLLRRTSPVTGTEWTLCALPLGGYVKMLDERDTDTPIAAQDLPHAFNRKPVGWRFAIVAGGPLANFLLAIVLLAGVYAGGVDEPVAMLAAPTAGSVAQRAGFVGGETVVAVRAPDGTTESVRSWSDLRWKLLDAQFDQRNIVLLAKVGNDTLDYSVDLSRAARPEQDEDVIERLGFEPGGKLRVASVEPGSAAQRAGLATGDVVVALDGKAVQGAHAFIATIQAHALKHLTITVERDGARRDIDIVPDKRLDAAGGNTVGRIGAAMATQVQTVDVEYGLTESLQLGARRTWDISTYSVRMFWRMLSGQASLKNLSGPVTIADYASKSAQLGAASFASFLALVSISLGVLNLLPIPVLDGGHLLYYLVEAVTGKAVSERWQLILQRAGLVCIVALSAIALFNDLSRLIHF
ncbi:MULTISPECIES: RIP metalloprotease RseP [Burkholderiaceae]|uniref:RIP metalloprotease RseP n=1 Tax=Burkholderiaceae TaxID=119060 RepID=UPI000964AF08|nr:MULTISPECIES: RIP metalloprotease RseP [Burkholderiaceae]MCG1018398.1 RIP metalloprotease RseP [Mycetohabitans sp. B4]SIT66337.1 site-2 protease. Metallo peptidase. MEROPS family M50B [Burkholderia sp. b13]